MLATTRADDPRSGVVVATAPSPSAGAVFAGSGLVEAGVVGAGFVAVPAAGAAVGGLAFASVGVAGPAFAGPGWAAARSPASPAIGAASSGASCASASGPVSVRACSADVLTAASLLGWPARWSPSDCCSDASPAKYSAHDRSTLAGSRASFRTALARATRSARSPTTGRSALSPEPSPASLLDSRSCSWYRLVGASSRCILRRLSTGRALPSCCPPGPKHSPNSPRASSHVAQQSVRTVPPAAPMTEPAGWQPALPA